MRKILTTALPLLVAAVATPAAATTEHFTTNSTTVTSTSGSGNGNSATFTATGGSDHVVMTAYQINQSTNVANTAQLGLYSPGVGDVGNGDFGGAYGYHQIDNANGYTDFVELVFDHAVTLTSIGITSFALNGSHTYDNDLAFLALTGPYSLSNSLTGWTNISNPGGTVPWNDPGVSSTDMINSPTASRYWLIAAAAGQHDDGFKISSLTVASVPEPASWAMMLVGFGAMGAMMRRRSNTTRLAQVA